VTIRGALRYWGKVGMHLAAFLILFPSPPPPGHRVSILEGDPGFRELAFDVVAVLDGEPIDLFETAVSGRGGWVDRIVDTGMVGKADRPRFIAVRDFGNVTFRRKLEVDVSRRPPRVIQRMPHPLRLRLTPRTEADA